MMKVMNHDQLTPEVEKILDRVPAWRDAELREVKPLKGLTNTNYVLTINDDKFVVRISGPNAGALRIDRVLEKQAIKAAAQAGIAPPVVEFILPEGHLVSHYIHGRHLDLAEYRTPKNLKRIVKTLKSLHSLPPVNAVFSPFHRVEAYTDQAQSLGVPMPPDFVELVEKASKIEWEQTQDSDPWRRFCHNDLFCVNVIDDGTIWFIDWEFAGMGDLYYDLATLAYAYDSEDTLSPDGQAFLLACYFGEVTSHHWSRLAGMKFMLMFFSAMWGLLQQGFQNRGMVPVIEGFSFSEYANNTFEAMRRTMAESHRRKSA